MATRKVSAFLEELAAEPVDPGYRKVWLRPTDASPACCFKVAPRAKKALSDCRIWVAMALQGRPKQSFKGDLCPLCVSGRVASGILTKK